MIQLCPACKIELPEEAYSPSRRNRKGMPCKSCSRAREKTWRENNKPAYRKRMLAWNEKNKERVAAQNKAAHMKRNYGLTEESYSAMLFSQNFSCAVCSGATKKFGIDHDHITGKVRGLLCHKCNVALGWIEQPDLLAACVRYLGGQK